MTLVQQIEHLIRENRSLRARVDGRCLECEALREEIRQLKECLIEQRSYHEHEHTALTASRVEVRSLQAELAHERLAYKRVYEDLDAVAKALGEPHR